MPRFLAGTSQGWLELGNHLEANEELEKITPELRGHPDVLQTRWHIYTAAERWDACLDIATALTTVAPKNPPSWCSRAAALHGLGRTTEAREVLLGGVDAAGENWFMFYELARYCCLLDRTPEARAWLGKAFDLTANPKAAAKFKLLALEDEDLKTLWSGGSVWLGGEGDARLIDKPEH